MTRQRKIVVAHVYPPIPQRWFDWCAWYDDDEPDDDGWMLSGHGKTQQEAIDNLLELTAQIDEAMSNDP